MTTNTNMNTNITRKQARELALHLIFEMSFQQLDEETIQERLDPIIREAISGDIALYAGKLSQQQTNYICRVVTGVAQHKESINQQIARYSKGWKIHRLSRITVAILQLAIYEMNEVEDVPTGVAINEAINLAKLYDNNEAPAFINGILGSIARAKEAQETQDQETQENPQNQETTEQAANLSSSPAPDDNTAETEAIAATEEESVSST